MGEDIVFAAKVEDCEDIDSLYRLCKQYELATITRDQFASIYVQFRLYIDARQAAEVDDESYELTESELAEVVGGGFWSSVGKWFKKNWKYVAIGVAVAGVVAGVTAAIICSGGSAAPAATVAASRLSDFFSPGLLTVSTII